MDNGYRIFILESRGAIDEQLQSAAYYEDEAAPLYVFYVSENGERNVWFYLSSDETASYTNSCTKPGELALISKLL